MKAAVVEHVRAGSLDEVFAALAGGGVDAKIIAGGQSLVPILNMRLAAPGLLVDLAGVPGLDGIAGHGGGLRIGAMARHRDVANSQLVAAHAPLIAQAMPHVAHAAIRNRGTFGGSLAHADPAGELPACALALEAVINAESAAAGRAIAAQDFFAGTYETALTHGEVLVSVDIPALGAGDRCAFAELARRRGDYAMVGLAAKATVSDGHIAGARLVFFAVSDRPLLATNAAAAIEGLKLGPAAIAAGQKALGGDLGGIFGDLHTSADAKRHLAGVLLGRVLRQLAEA